LTGQCIAHWWPVLHPSFEKTVVYRRCDCDLAKGDSLLCQFAFWFLKPFEIQMGLWCIDLMQQGLPWEADAQLVKKSLAFCVFCLESVEFIVHPLLLEQILTSSSCMHRYPKLIPTHFPIEIFFALVMCTIYHTYPTILIIPYLIPH
jgi:hypothetical protein